MRKIASIVFLMSFLFFHLGTVPSYAQGKEIDIIVDGIWESNFGKLVLVQHGNSIEGHYTHDKGKIKGRLEGNVFIGKWMEQPTYKPRRDAGDVRLVFAKDGKSFSGHWRYGFGGTSWNGKWTGKKLDHQARLSSSIL